MRSYSCQCIEKGQISQLCFHATDSLFTTFNHMCQGTPLSYLTCHLLSPQLPPHHFNFQSSLVLCDNANKNQSPHRTTAELLLSLMLLCKLSPSTPVLSYG